MESFDVKPEIIKKLARTRECINALKCSRNAVNHTNNSTELHSLITVLADSLSSAVDIAEEDLIELFDSQIKS